MRLEAQSAKLCSGSAIHHPHHGIGKVQSTSERKFGGTSARKFTKLYFEREALTLILPMKDAAETVRSPINRKQARQILDHIETWEGRASKRWKARAATHQAAMDRGDPFEYAEVFKCLRQLEAEGSLRQTDRGHLDQAVNYLGDELSFALGTTSDQARELITRAADKPV